MDMNEALSDRPVVQIGVISDDGYAVPTTVMLASAELNKSPGSVYEVHCLCNGMSDFCKSKLRALHRPDFRIHIIDCSGEKYAHIQLPPGITASTMIKCDLAELLPGVDKLLLLDGDILVKQDLTELWQTDITGKIVAAADDMPAMEELRLHELLDIEHYFNAGVMLLNLDIMRRENIGHQIIQAKENAPSSWKLGEQDPFNKVCHNRRVFLPLKWNMSPLSFLYWEYCIEHINRFFGTSYSTYTEMEDDAGIIHFCALKPWRNRLMPYAPLWQKYHDLSPYGNTNLTHEPEYPPARPTVDTTSGYIKLFGRIPFISYNKQEKRNDYTTLRVHLFKYIPFITVTDSGPRKLCVLFGFLRLYKLKRKHHLRKFYLFGCLHVYSSARAGESQYVK